MPDLIINRKKQIYAPMNCCFHVFVDDKKQTTLTNGDNDRFSVVEGKHEMFIRNNYFASRKVTLDFDNNDKEFETYGNPILGWLYVIAPIILIIYSGLKLFHVSLPKIISPLALSPLFLFIVLALVLGIFKKGVLVKEIQ